MARDSLAGTTFKTLKATTPTSIYDTPSEKLSGSLTGMSGEMRATHHREYLNVIRVSSKFAWLVTLRDFKMKHVWRVPRRPKRE